MGLYGGVEGLTLAICCLGLAGVAHAAYLYLRPDPNVPARALLLGLRILSLLIVTGLLVDLEIPGGDPSRPSPAGGKWILVDPDLSLELPGQGSASLWEVLLDSAAAGAQEGARLALALPGDGGLEVIDYSGLEARRPTSLRSNFEAGVTRLGEAGADSVVLLSTLRRSAAEIEVLGAETPLPVRLLRIGETSRNLGIGELQLPAVALGGEELIGRVVLYAEGGALGDSVRVEIRADGDLVRIIYAQVPPAGEERSVQITLPPQPDSGLVRYTARGFLEGDLFPSDDLRAQWVLSGRESPEILLVSLRPDWEPRVLLPVLEAVTGLEGRGYLRLADGRFLSLAEGAAEVQAVPEGSLRTAATQSQILVIHGSVDDPPAWLAAVVEEHPRVLHLPDTPGGVRLAGLDVDSARSGEWVPTSELPPSPLAPFLAGVSLVGLPPLSDVLPLTRSSPGTAGLNVQGLRNEAALPALVFVEADRRRRAVTLADGFWRWGMRDGEARRAYRSIWGGVMAWLLEGERARSGEVARPATVLQPRDEPLRWDVSPEASDLEISLIRLHDGGEELLDPESDESLEPSFVGRLEAAGEGSATSPPVEPGIYRFELRASSATPSDSIAAGGIVEVERWAASLRIPPLDVANPILAGPEGEGVAGAQAGRPLRTHPLPYVVMLILLGAEWLGRRRVGLS